MTTILFKDDVIYADTLTSTGMHAVHVKKLFKSSDGQYIAGGAGQLPDLLNFMMWLDAGGDMDVKLTGNQFDGMSLDRDGVLCTYDENLIPYYINRELSPMVALGSGAGLLMGALEAGATVYEAWNIVCKHDPGTGAVVESVYF